MRYTVRQAAYESDVKHAAALCRDAAESGQRTFPFEGAEPADLEESWLRAFHGSGDEMLLVESHGKIVGASGVKVGEAIETRNGPIAVTTPAGVFSATFADLARRHPGKDLLCDVASDNEPLGRWLRGHGDLMESLNLTTITLAQWKERKPKRAIHRASWAETTEFRRRAGGATTARQWWTADRVVGSWEKFLVVANADWRGFVACELYRNGRAEVFRMDSDGDPDLAVDLLRGLLRELISADRSGLDFLTATDEEQSAATAAGLRHVAGYERWQVTSTGLDAVSAGRA